MPACVTIGNFDGVHRGHQSLLGLAKSIAEDRSLDFALVTFWPHPREVLKGASFHKPLTARSEKMKLLRQYGARNIIEIPFTPEFSQMSAREFIEKHLLPLEMKELVVGHDFSLGRQREGHIERLRELGQMHDFHVTQAPAFAIGGLPVSSTRLRREIETGNVREAARMLGRFHSVSGTVGHGFARGRDLGFPTANLVNPDSLLPGHGVYATFAHLGDRKYEAITNIGVNPTFGNQTTSVETFLLDASGDFYGQPIALEFVDFIRPERRFASAEQLAEQIHADIGDCRKLLAHARN